MTELMRLRLKKALFPVLRPACWLALTRGVAPSIEHLPVLRMLEIDGIIDVGANRGQFTLACRMVSPGVPIVAFEPIPHEAKTFRWIHGGFGYIKLVQTALGETTGEAVLHLSRSADSSSLLPIGENQRRMFSKTEEVGTLKVPVKRLDDFWDEWRHCSRMLLKIDVQGYELPVLKGAEKTLRQCAYVYAECSDVPLYDGQALRTEVSTFLEVRGFKVRSRHNESFDQGRLVQADYLFGRI